MNMIQFSNGIFAEQGNVQRRVPSPLPSFNPAPEALPGVPVASESAAANETSTQPETPVVESETVPETPAVETETPVQTTEEKA